MKKKLCALALCVIMVVALAVPAFAETSPQNAKAAPRIGVYQIYTISPKNSSGQYITAMNGNVNRAVNLWPYAANQVNYQKWMPGRYNTDAKLYANFTVGGSTQYVLTRDIQNLAYTYSEYDTTSNNSQVDFRTIGTNEYRIHFSVANVYLAAYNTSNGASISFASYGEADSAQKWYVR